MLVPPGDPEPLWLLELEPLCPDDPEDFELGLCELGLWDPGLWEPGPWEPGLCELGLCELGLCELGLWDDDGELLGEGMLDGGMLELGELGGGELLLDEQPASAIAVPSSRAGPNRVAFRLRGERVG